MSEQTVVICEGVMGNPRGKHRVVVDVVERTVTLDAGVPGLGGWLTRFAAPEPDDLPPEARELLAQGKMPVIERYYPLQARNVLKETHDNDALMHAETTLVERKEDATRLLELPKDEAEAILHYFFRAPPLHNATCAALLAGRLEPEFLYGVKDGYQDRHRLPNASCSAFGFATRPGWLLERFRAQY